MFKVNGAMLTSSTRIVEKPPKPTVGTTSKGSSVGSGRGLESCNWMFLCPLAMASLRTGTRKLALIW